QFEPPGLCPGIFFFHGCLGWALLHVTAVYLFIGKGLREGEWLWPVVGVVVLVAIWVLFVFADVRFRRLLPTRGQQAGVDNAALNLFGFVVFLFTHVFGGLALIGLGVYWAFRLVIEWVA